MCQNEDSAQGSLEGGLKSLPAFCAPDCKKQTHAEEKFIFHCSEDRLGRGVTVWLELARTRQASILCGSERGLQDLLQPQLCD